MKKVWRLWGRTAAQASSRDVYKRQAILAMVIGCLVIAVALVVIGNCGHKYGIPYTVQLRSRFGTTGVKVPGLLRGCLLYTSHMAWYTKGMPHSATLRNEINQVETLEGFIELLDRKIQS